MNDPNNWHKYYENQFQKTEHSHDHFELDNEGFAVVHLYINEIQQR